MHLLKTRVACAAVVGLAATMWTGSVMEAQRDARGAPAASGLDVAKTIDTYCAGCHNSGMRSPSGGVLDHLDATRIDARADIWSRAYRQLQAGAMPPVGAPQPDRPTATAMLSAIEEGLGAHTAPPRLMDGAAVATRLAAMLWRSEPDAELQQEAQRGRLRDAAAVEGQVRRMLADDRARAFVASFFVPWLQLDQLAKADPDTKYFPDYDVSLRDALAEETELFVLSQLRDDRDPIELWSAGYTFLNERLARHYGVPGVTGPEFRRVPVSRPERAGLLGHGSIHMVTSRHQRGVDAMYTSPATRAKWVRLHFLGAALPDGFPGAQPVKPELPIAPQTRALPAEPCENCHRNFFPLGYALEHFDPIGRWRTHDQAGPVDPTGIVDGTAASGIIGMRQALLRRPDAFRTTITEQLLAYAATGTAAVASQTPTTLVRARQILRTTPAPRWSAIIAKVGQGTGEGRSGSAK
jgi:hypothetical protein